MEYFRWILLFAGLLLIVYMFFSGRRKNKESNYLKTQEKGMSDPLFTDQRAQRHDSQIRDETSLATDYDPYIDFTKKDDLNATNQENDLEFFTPLDDMSRVTPIPDPPPKLLTSITEKIEAFSAKLTPKRKARMDASIARSTVDQEPQADEEKILSLCVTAAEGEFLDGAEMYAIFLQRGYYFGDMGLFHSRYKGKSIFSVANMMEPGSFNLETIESLQTPGITLFLQLPGPIAADVLFEVLVSEASDIARALGASVRDNRRSNLTKQTIQHMREDIYQYMHRVKYFNAKVH